MGLTPRYRSSRTLVLDVGIAVFGSTLSQQNCSLGPCTECPIGMETEGFHRGYIGIIMYRLGLYRIIGKKNKSYYFGFRV